MDLVIVDYLQLMTGTKRTDNRVNEISEITRNLKVMAKELNVPVMALSQLRRPTERTKDHRPGLSELRDSGSIEQDADIVIFLHREAYNATSEGGQVTEDMDQTPRKSSWPKTVTARQSPSLSTGRASTCASPPWSTSRHE